MSTFRIGPIVNSVFYDNERDAIPSSTGPFRSLQEFFGALIQKEKKFFNIHGVQELVKREMDQTKATSNVVELVEKLDLLQSKLSNIFNELIDQKKPFTLIHGDFNAQNILVEHSNDKIKIIGIINWEFLFTGNLWNLCEYPTWIEEEPGDLFEVLSDVKLQENYEKQKLRNFFHNEMIVKLGNKSGQILKMKEQDWRISKLEDMFSYMVHNCLGLKGLLECFFHRYGLEITNIHFGDPIIDYFWSPYIIKVQIPSKRVIMYLLSKDEL